VLLALAAAFAGRGQRAASQTIQVVLVTSAGDQDDARCPDAAACTLRKAIELVNAAPAGGPYTIAFAEAAFPLASPATILLATPLPVIARAEVAVDAAGRGVILDGSQLEAGVPAIGLLMSGAQAVVRGMQFQHFPGACLMLDGPFSRAGDGSEGSGNRLGSCSTGILLSGQGGAASGNVVGFGPGGQAAPVDRGILVTAGGVAVGGEAGGNVVGNAGTAIQVGAEGVPAFSGVRIVSNTVGRGPDGAPAPVTVGVDLVQPSSGTRVASNTIAHAAQAAIRVAADAGGVSVNGNTFDQNLFAGLGGMAIDLDADGIMNPNHDEPGGGANNLLNHPVITRATQAELIGSAPGCDSCSVTVYRAFHQPGAARDYGTVPVPGASGTTDSAGGFRFESPPLQPGDWVLALVTDVDGNTSEFGPSARVGAGLVQCTNPTLQQGWNHAGYFGLAPLALDSTYPPGSPFSPVSAIYHLANGLEAYLAWFAGTSEGRTLFSLEPGEAYWFFGLSPVAQTGGFTLTAPVPVALRAGWNDFVYIGATADVRDALSSVAGNYTEVYQFVNDGVGARWHAFGGPDTPDWVRQFTTMESCGVYQVRMTEDATLIPLQP
jgi:hypothetical protein